MPTQITKTIEAFTFSELSERAKDKVRQWHSQGLDYEWYDGVYDQYRERLAVEGFMNPKFQFTGFWSQGDGASFSCDFHFTGDQCKQWVSDALWESYTKLQTAFRLMGHEAPVLWMSGCVETHGRYCHEMSMSMAGERVSLDLPLTSRASDLEEGSVLGDLWDETTDRIDQGYDDADFTGILEHCRDIARDLYKDLQKEYEWLTSDEQVIETCAANNYLFDEDGDLI